MIEKVHFFDEPPFDNRFILFTNYKKIATLSVAFYLYHFIFNLLKFGNFHDFATMNDGKISNCFHPHKVYFITFNI